MVAREDLEFEQYGKSLGWQAQLSDGDLHESNNPPKYTMSFRKDTNKFIWDTENNDGLRWVFGQRGLDGYFHFKTYYATLQEAFDNHSD